MWHHEKQTEKERDSLAKSHLLLSLFIKKYITSVNLNGEPGGLHRYPSGTRFNQNALNFHDGSLHKY